MGATLGLLVRGSSVASGLPVCSHDDTVIFREILYPSQRVPFPRWSSKRYMASCEPDRGQWYASVLTESRSCLSTCGWASPSCVCSGRLVNASEQHFVSRQEELKMFTGLEKKKFSPDATKMRGGYC